MKRMPDGELWTEYWMSGNLRACTEEFPAHAASRIAGRWTQLFEGLASGSAILDVATGNGAVLAIAKEAACEKRRFEAIGIDRAMIDPVASAGLVGNDWISIRFLGGVDAASIPFPDRAFDLVTSQFGLEYADFDQAISEACRVCRGRLQFLVHAAEGIVVRQNAIQVDQADWLQKELGLFDALREHVRRADKRTRERLESIARSIRMRITELENPDLLVRISRDAGRLLNVLAKFAPAQIESMIDGMELRLAQHAARMKGLEAAARTEEDLAAAAEICRNCGFAKTDVEAERTGESGFLVGWWMVASRVDSRPEPRGHAIG